MAYANPTIVNKTRILNCMALTFKERRQWILTEKLSVTEITDKYKHFKSYEGDVISQEFELMFPKHQAFVEEFPLMAPAVLQHASRSKKTKFQEASWISDGAARALLLLVEMFPPNFLGVENEGSEDEAFRRQGLNPTAKVYLHQFPSSSLLQIAPSRTEVDSYYSIEISEDDVDEDWKPMCPYLLWLSSDKKAGDLYLKIDRLSFYCGHFNLESEDGQGIFLKGFDLLFKAYHVFHREYHVYLSAFMNFIESVYKIGSKQSASTKSLRGYISSYRKKQL